MFADSPHLGIGLAGWQERQLSPAFAPQFGLFNVGQAGTIAGESKWENRKLAMADAGGIAADRLKAFIERIERLDEEKAAIAGDIREVFSEAKSAGFDTKIMRQVIRLRKMERNHPARAAG